MSDGIDLDGNSFNKNYKVLKETAEKVYVDIGFTVLEIPLTDITGRKDLSKDAGAPQDPLPAEPQAA